MQLPRFAHTLTKLPDGRILAAGGKDMSLAQRLSMDGSVWSWASTNTAEIYGPATNAWTLTAGRLNNDRAYHAAQLLPTGQVLIVGGYHADLTGNISWPATVEIFDPTTGTFSVMDSLQYGIESPQLVLMKNGGVFVAGQVKEPLESPDIANSNELQPNRGDIGIGFHLERIITNQQFGYIPKSASTPVTDPNIAKVYLVARDLDLTDMKWSPADNLLAEHTGWVIETSKESRVYQAGPDKDNNNILTVWLNEDKAGKGLHNFSQVTNSEQVTHTFYVSILRAYTMTRFAVEDIDFLINLWNEKKIPYGTFGPNCNTFSNWFGKSINAKPLPSNGFGIFHPLPGWSTPLQQENKCALYFLY